jgi:hypothetical protein
MLRTTPVRVVRAKKSSNCVHDSVNGARPDIGKADTELSRAESKLVSCPCTNGDEADSAMQCGM